MTNPTVIAQELEATRFLKPESRAKFYKNPLLVKPKTGQGKRSVYDLPDSSSFVYGKKNKPDKEGAGQVILTWKESNADANSVEKQRYLKEKAKPNLPSKAKDSTFGIKSVYGETAKELVNYKFELDWVKAQQEIVSTEKQMAQERKKKQDLLNTQAAHRREQALLKQKQRKNALMKRTRKGEFGEPPSAEGLYKLKKFNQVPSKLVTRGPTENLCTTNMIKKQNNKQSEYDRTSVHSHQSKHTQDNTGEEHPDDASFVSELRDDISVHSSVSQRF